LAYGGERLDGRALDELEAVLQVLSEELTSLRARAVRPDGDGKESAKGGGGRPDAELRNRVADLEAENKELRQRVEAARARVHELLGRLTFLEEQAREPGPAR
jgi:hypothetical protein